ncbi:type II toxin-antitoxin system RnlA family toxin [Bacillus sp. RG28]|uniref:Type II toxin-antitoxin system RnlA family toxin n=1 Tax=Gottfriedia endophytica TaxID=2820819 RepID=A0A940NSJ7_9BACI|nr:type II toxin-antitoxin system RnlA family toxin [Gottfriedia endophytica]MBP0726758.1 type II toxin-antitoxin system RnlA family toxin [Gottfriedia endophytica]
MYNLKREKISDSIRKFYSLKEVPCEISDINELGGTRRRIHINEKDGIRFFIDFHFLKNGTTSIDKSSGGISEVKNQISEFIIVDPECVLGDVTSGSKYFIAKNIEHEDFEGIMEILCESEYCKGKNPPQKNITFELYKFTGHYNEPLTIHYYLTTKKILIQGRPLLLFTEAMSLIAELIELDEIPRFFNENYKIDILKSDVEQQFDYYFPYSHDKHPAKLKKVLHQAVYNLQIQGEMFVYSYLVFPALKALEGHLKYSLYNYNITLDDNRFNMFKYDESGRRYYLKTTYHSNVGDPSKIAYFEKGYNFYNKHRHSLVHWADPSSPIDDTREIENIGEARTLIIDTFNIIDEYYK